MNCEIRSIEKNNEPLFTFEELEIGEGVLQKSGSLRVRIDNEHYLQLTPFGSLFLNKKCNWLPKVTGRKAKYTLSMEEIE